MAGGSVSLLERLPLEVGDQFPDLGHVGNMHVSGAAFLDKVGATLVAAKMAGAWGLELEHAIPPGADLRGRVLTILIRLSSPLWFFSFCFCRRTFVFSFFE
jgi:hypothetical protein